MQVRPVSSKGRFMALLLCLFLGWIGVHRFYVGKVGTGFLYLFTGGGFALGNLFDLAMILFGSFTDKAGLPVSRWF